MYKKSIQRVMLLWLSMIEAGMSTLLKFATCFDLTFAVFPCSDAISGLYMSTAHFASLMVIGQLLSWLCLRAC
jgi:hypothetical protein